MFCSKCGTVVADGAGFCSACGQPIASTGIAPGAYARAVSQPTVAYAGFWLRFVALIIDGIVLGTVGWIVTLPFMASFGLRDILRGHPPTRPEDFFPFFGLILRLAMIRLALNWLYYAFMESSSWQATLGKKALGLEVTDLEGRRVSFGRASGRFFGKILSSMILFIGFIMAGFTEKKQALHDMLAGCLVIRKL
jgi:uncharacterized RDD family membrane protein YckC